MICQSKLSILLTMARVRQTNVGNVALYCRRAWVKTLKLGTKALDPFDMARIGITVWMLLTDRLDTIWIHRQELLGSDWLSATGSKVQVQQRMLQLSSIVRIDHFTPWGLVGSGINHKSLALRARPRSW